MSKNQNQVKLMIQAVLYILIAILLVTTVTFAWFTSTNLNNANLISQVSGVEAQYEFYVYNDPSHEGSDNLTLVNNTTSDEAEYDKYLYIVDPTSLTLIDGYIAPGEKFSFAIKITNTGTALGHVTLSFSDVVSYGDLNASSMIGQAVSYTVTKVSFMNFSNVETDDIKDTYDLNYSQQYFSGNNFTNYELIERAPLNDIDYTITIIYFDIYFDPTVFGTDSLGTPYENSNIFMGQILRINHINMVLSA